MKTSKSIHVGRRASALVSFFVVLAFAAGAARAAETASSPGSPDAGVQKDTGKLRALVVTGGHEFDPAFFKLFEGYPDLEYRKAEHQEAPEREANRELSAERARAYDVLVLYDLHQEITDEARRDFQARLEEGKGLVVLHHAMANYQGWPEYRKIAGGRFFLAPMEEGGQAWPRSTASAVQEMKVTIADPAHPIVLGLDDFSIEDEPYGGFAVEPGVHPLLTTDCPASGKVMAWCHSYGKARVVTVQLGHDARAYNLPAYREIVVRSIRWAAGRRCDGGASEAVFSTLRRAHPRIILAEGDAARLRDLAARDAGARKLLVALRGSARKLLDAPPVEFKIVGPRLLSQSRRCLQRVYLLSLLYLLEGDRAFRDRAVKELSAAADFPHWNPSHFLDTAEMAHAFAIGYDWLHGALSEEERGMARRALVEKGLEPSLDFYRKARGWTRVRHNWNQVCSGGMAIGALAVAEEEPELAGYIVSRAVSSVRLPMAEYAPDGAWSEGPGYWHYATRYNVYLLAALDSALGKDFELSRMPGFSETGSFRLHFTGPIGLTFNFADGGAGAGSASEMFWLARKFQQPVLAWEQRRQMGDSDALDLVWYDSRGGGPRSEGVPTCARFRKAEVAFLRTAWEDPRALFIGFKGGDNRANHSHLDLGTFVFDGLGVRWVHDLGADDYNLPGYFGGKRWTYYRLRSEGHNVVVIDGKNQDPRAASPLVGFGGGPDFSHAVADLSAAYPEALESHRRGVALVGGRRALVLDEIEVSRPAEIRWTIHVPSEIQLQGERAEISAREEKMAVRVIEPAGAKLEVLPASGPEPEAQARGISRLSFRLAARPGERLRIRVDLAPHRSGEPVPELAEPVAGLDAWGK